MKPLNSRQLAERFITSETLGQHEHFDAIEELFGCIESVPLDVKRNHARVPVALLLGQLDMEKKVIRKKIASILSTRKSLKHQIVH